MVQNAVDGSVCFLGHTDAQRNMVKWANMLLIKQGDVSISYKYDHLVFGEEDLVIKDNNSTLIRK